MLNRFEIGAAALGARFQQVAGRDGVYSRGPSTTGLIIGTLGEMQRPVLNEDGFGTGSFVSAWIFAAVDLTFPTDGDITPRPGDRWTEDLGVWEVMPPGPGLQCCKWLDSSGLLFLVWFSKVKV